jgi:hypothetical protein
LANSSTVATITNEGATDKKKNRIYMVLKNGLTTKSHAVFIKSNFYSTIDM